MRKAMILLAVFGLAGSLWGADPLIGTWKLNVAKSKIPQTETALKVLTEIYRELGADQIEFTRIGTQIDGTPISSKWTWPRLGGIVERLSPAPLPEDMSYVETVIEPGNWYVTVLQNGKQITVIHKTFSKDGRTMRQTITSTNAQSQTSEQLLVFDKQ
jgi:hypothetical protein